MKKTIICLAALAMMAAGCSQKDDLAVTNTDPNAICFSAYTSTAVTRGVVKTSTDVQSEGIGVFAFYQPAVRNAAIDFNSRKYATPDFMYNQAVTYSDPDWTYTPRKYWPNNDSDQVSFFAYAPYDEDKTWEDLGITTDASASKLTATFPIYTEKPAMQDVLWATPQLNKQKPSVTEGAVNNPITFSFEHILSKVALYVGVETDQAKGEAGKWNYDSTTITIDKVEFTNLASAVNYVGTITAGQVSASSFTPATTTQNIVLTKENGDFRDSIALISKSGYWQTAGFHDLLSYEDASCTTCGASQDPSEGLGNGYTNAFLFLAPQSFTADKEQVIITYTVATVDSANAANNSTITNTIATDLATVLETTKSAKDGKFVSGKAYTLKFLIGMNSVKLAATVGDWDDAIEDTIYVPANEEIPVQVVGEDCTISNLRKGVNSADSTVLFEVTSTSDNLKVLGSKDGTTWLSDNLLISGSTLERGKCIKSGDASPYTFTYRTYPNDTIKYLKVQAFEFETVALTKCVTFKCQNEFTLGTKNNVKNWNGTLEYSKDSTTWTVWDATSPITAGEKAENYYIYLKGTENTTFYSTSSSYTSFTLTATDTIHVSGDIMSLLNYYDPSMEDYCFAYLFSGCTAKMDCSKLQLPATTLAECCYYGMFYNCKSLTTAPALPATTLAESCYNSMFYGCTGLKTAPELLATTLAKSCYNSMFYNCNTLVNVPETLPAETLLTSCYNSMFYRCQSLTTAPALSATTLADSCYQSMFEGCSQLVNVPQSLPAKTLARYCYHNMFKSCTSLTSAPKLPATTLAKNCYCAMFEKCSTLVNVPDSLPATTLADCCYRAMFMDCKLLTAAPVLPATELATECYYGMFSNCEKLIAAPKLPATTLADCCYTMMFHNCKFITTAPELPATNLKIYCYQYMFSGCTSLTTAPELPAVKLVYYCYAQMFSDCHKLSNVTMLATENITLTSWLKNAGDSVTTPILKVNESIKNISNDPGYSINNNTPSYWTIKNAADSVLRAAQ